MSSGVWRWLLPDGAGVGVLPPAHSPICLCHLWTGSASPAPPVYSKHRIYQTAHQNKRKEKKPKSLSVCLHFHILLLSFLKFNISRQFSSHTKVTFTVFFNPEKKRFSPGFLDQPPLLPRHSATLPRSVMNPFSGVPGMWFFGVGAVADKLQTKQQPWALDGPGRPAVIPPPHQPGRCMAWCF